MSKDTFYAFETDHGVLVRSDIGKFSLSAVDQHQNHFEFGNIMLFLGDVPSCILRGYRENMRGGIISYKK